MLKDVLTNKKQYKRLCNIDYHRKHKYCVYLYFKNSFVVKKLMKQFLFYACKQVPSTQRIYLLKVID